MFNPQNYLDAAKKGKALQIMQTLTGIPSSVQSPDNTPKEKEVTDTYTGQYDGVNMDEANQLANESILAAILYGKPVEKERFHEDTQAAREYSKGLREKAANQDLLGSKLNTMGNIKDAARYTAQAAASGVAGTAALGGGDVSSDKITATNMANAVSPAYSQMAQQLAQAEQGYQQNLFTQNQLEGANNTDVVSHDNTRDYISEDHPLKPLMDKLAMQQGAMNYLANKKYLESGKFMTQVNGTQEEKV